MKKIAFAVALAIVSLSAQAQTYTPVEPKPYRFLGGIGITGGGEELATARYTNGASEDITTGGVFSFHGGVEFPVSENMTVQGNFGYHFDQTSATNGDIRLDRFPLEVLGYYQVSPQWRIGGGARFVTGIKLKSSGAGDIGDYKFDNTVGGVIEAEYFFSPDFGVKLRYVSEKYEEKLTKTKFDANHVGLYGNFYF